MHTYKFNHTNPYQRMSPITFIGATLINVIANYIISAESSVLLRKK